MTLVNKDKCQVISCCNNDTCDAGYVFVMFMVLSCFPKLATLSWFHEKL